jgi:hypothetical protein
MARTSPTQRTLRALRDQGMKCGIVERYVAKAGPFGKKFDLFGIIDIIALDPVRGVIGIQSTGIDFRNHFLKMTEEQGQDVLDWIRTPGTVLQLWGWRKIKVKRGGKAMIYEPRIHEFTEADVLGQNVPEDEEGVEP